MGEVTFTRNKKDDYWTYCCPEGTKFKDLRVCLQRDQDAGAWRMPWYNDEVVFRVNGKEAGPETPISLVDKAAYIVEVENSPYKLPKKAVRSRTEKNEYHALREKYLKENLQYEPANAMERDKFVEKQYRGCVPFSLYGVGNEDFDRKCLKLNKRMLVETKQDHTSLAAVDAIKATLTILGEGVETSHGVFRLPLQPRILVVDPFCGAGNLFYHCVTGLGGLSEVSGVAYESSHHICDTVKHNLRCLGVENMTVDHGDGLKADVPDEERQLVVVLVDPPWGKAWSEKQRLLDLAMTEPPVADIIARFREKLPRTTQDHRLLCVVPCPMATNPDSLDGLWSVMLPLCIDSPEDLEDRTAQRTIVGVAVP
eukprot:Sspe_Gene.72653::Locus_43464_Transcript_2_2_Confidence_0.800_Length_1214::g.72653::m.72653